MLKNLRSLRFLVIGIILITLCYQVLTATVLREAYEGDEGFYGTVALNMEHAWYYWLKPTPVPDGSFYTMQERLAHPCIHCIFLAMAGLLLGQNVAVFQIVPLISFILVLFFFYRLIALRDRAAALFTLLLIAISPVIVGEFRLLQAEPVIAAAGLAGIYLAIIGIQKNKLIYAASAGACFGMGFLLKLWLSLPYLMAGGTAILVLSWLDQWPLRRICQYVSILSLAFLTTSLLHLAAITLWAPEDLTFWIRKVYLGIFTGEGVTGSKFHGDMPGLPPNWVHPFWYYFVITYRDHFFLFPLIALGLPFFRRRDWLAMSWVIPGILSMIPLSFFAIKSPLYVLSSSLFFYALAGICVSALVARSKQPDLPRYPIYGTIVTATAAVALLAILLCYHKGIQAHDITLTYVLLHTAAMLATIVVTSVWISPFYKQAKTAFLTCSISLFALTVAADIATRTPSDAILSDMMKPYVSDIPSSHPAFLAPNFKSFQLYLKQRGLYWHNQPLNQPPEAFVRAMQDRGVRVFILGPDEVSNPQIKPILSYLQTHAREMTDLYASRSGQPSDRRFFILTPPDEGHLAVRYVTASPGIHAL